MRFCTKDGTPLINYDEPVKATPPQPPFLSEPETPVAAASQPPLDETMSDLSSFQVQQPTQSESVETFEEEEDEPQTQVAGREKFVVSVDEPPVQQQVQPIAPPPAASQQFPPQPPPSSAQTAQPAKRKSNTALFVVLGVLLAFGLLGIAGLAGAYYFFFSKPSEVAVANTNSNINANTEISNDNAAEIPSIPPPFETNTNTNTEDNTNTSTNANENLNANANTRPSPTPRTSPTPANRNTNQTVEIEPSQPEPSPTPAPRPSPVQTPQGGRTVGGGVVNGKATSLPKPSYPPSARAARAEGQVNVQVLIDENGNVTSANAITGHPLLRPAAASAARQAKFAPTVVGGQPAKVSGVIVYNFILNQ